MSLAEKQLTTETTTVYGIRDRHGRVVAEHVRFDNADGTKQVLWRQTDGAWGLNGTPVAALPLYGSEWASKWSDDDKPVVVVEGEAAAEALLNAGFKALGTVTGASGTPETSALEVLRGLDVVLWPDEDTPGVRHMERVAARLQGIATSVSFYRWPEADPDSGEDAADHPAIHRGSDKALDRLLQELMEAPKWEGPKAPPVGTVLADVEPEQVTWLWDRRIPRGKLTIIDGDPDLGKSALSTDLAARVSVGRTFPDGAPGEKAGVVLMNAEDGLADTIRPRLDAAGGDATKVLSLATEVDEEGYERILSIPEDIPIIERGIKQMGAALVVVDPLMAFLSPEINAHKDQDVRRGLAPLANMAERTGAAIVVVRHLNKMSGGNAKYRGGGSIGIIGAARSGLVVGEHPQDEDLRILASNKGNLCKKAPSLQYRIKTALNGSARVEWEGESHLNASDLIQAPDTPEEKSALGEAVEWLKDELLEGPMTAAVVWKNSRKAGISDRTMKRAKSLLHVHSEKESDGSWTWSLPQPPEDPKGAKEAHTKKAGTLGTLGTLDEDHGAKEAYIREVGQGGQGGQQYQYREPGTLDGTLDGEEVL